jgi:hypothetical protein
MNTVLFLQHHHKECGVYSYGQKIFNILSKSKVNNYIYSEADSEDEFNQVKREVKPSTIIYNHYESTMPWLTEEVVSKNIKYQQILLFDKGLIPYNCDKYFFLGDYGLGYEKVQESKRVLLPRPIPEFEYTPIKNEVPTIGSFGFGFRDKGFERLVKLVNDTFDEAVININMPLSIYQLPGENEEIVQKCLDANYKSNIKLNLTHDYYLDDKDLMKFLSKNDVNAFYYYERKTGISGVLDYCLAVGRPIAISKCDMFSHMWTPEIIIPDNSLVTIIKNGLKPLRRYYKKWDREILIDRVDEEVG